MAQLKHKLNPPRLGPEFYCQDTTELARDLLGKTLVRRVGRHRLRAVIVEVEAYLSTGDPASHSFRGPSRKNNSMFGPAGTLYVYSIHARHCMNIVTEASGSGAAVLIRGIEPLNRLDLLAGNRKLETSQVDQLPGMLRLTQGPGRLCEALDIDRGQDGIDLTQSDICWLEETDAQCTRAWQTTASPRIGISRATEFPLRFFVDGNRFVSGCARDHTQGRKWTFANNE